MDRRFVSWGIFFIVLGAVPILVRQGVIEPDVARRALSLWPLFLVAIGLGLLFRGTRGDWLGGLMAATIAGVMAGGVLASGTTITGGICSDGPVAQTSGVWSGNLADDRELNVHMPCGDLKVVTAAGSGWAVEAKADDPRRPEIREDRSGVTITASDGPGPFFDAIASRASWTVTVPADPTIDLSVSVDAGGAEVDLSGAHLAELVVSVNAGSLQIDAARIASLGTFLLEVNAGDARIALPPRNVRGRFEANAGSLSFCVPAGLAVQITLEQDIATGNNFEERGLARSGDRWTRAGVDPAGPTIELNVAANASSVTLDPEEGC